MSIQCLDFSYFCGAGNPTKGRNSGFGKVPLRVDGAPCQLSPLSVGTGRPVSSFPHLKMSLSDLAVASAGCCCKSWEVRPGREEMTWCSEQIPHFLQRPADEVLK